MNLRLLESKGRPMEVPAQQWFDTGITRMEVILQNDPESGELVYLCPTSSGRGRDGVLVIT
jgi:hypothetical protein